MSNIPVWYDYNLGYDRNDVWPFQKHFKTDKKFIAKIRLSQQVQRAIKKLPEGWSIKWKASRRRTFRVNHTTKTITIPMPAQHSGMPIVSSALYLSAQINNAMIAANSHGIVPAYGVKAWPFLYGAHFSVYKATYLPGGGWISRNHPSVKRAGIQTAREVLRFMQSPDAWRVPRRKAGSPVQYYRPHIDTHTLAAIAHRKVLTDYLKVNDPAYPLPAIAKARLQKIDQSTTQP